MNTNAQVPLRRVTYVVSIWREPPREDPARWQGVLETTAGQRFDFARLEELDRLLCELGGWSEPLKPQPGACSRGKNDTQ